MDVQPDWSELPAGPDRVAHAVVTLRAGGSPRRRPGLRLSVVLLLDVSASMSGEPLAQQIRLVDQLLRLLDAHDSVALVAFASHASVLVPLRPLDPRARQRIAVALADIHAEGGTDLGEALDLAGSLFKPPQPDERQVVLVLSDGQPTLGFGAAYGHQAASSPGEPRTPRTVRDPVRPPQQDARPGRSLGERLRALFAPKLPLASAPPPPTASLAPPLSRPLPPQDGPLSRREGSAHPAAASTLSTGTRELLTVQARRLRARGISLSALGHGHEPDEQVLCALAACGGGHYALATDVTRRESQLWQALGEEPQVILERPFLKLAPGEGVRLVRAVGGPELLSNRTGIYLPLLPLCAGETATFLVEVAVRPRAPGALPLLEASLLALGALGQVELGRVVASVQVVPSSCAARPNVRTTPIVAAALIEERLLGARKQAQASAARPVGLRERQTPSSSAPVSSAPPPSSPS